MPIFTINDDKGNPLNLPNSSSNNQGIARSNGNALISVTDNQGNIYPRGFTPEEAYYIDVNGDKFNVNNITGFNNQSGSKLTPVSLNNNTSQGKKHLTELTWDIPKPDSNTLNKISGKNTFKMVGYTEKDGRIVPTPGFVNPLDYVVNSSNLNTLPGLTGVPKELGDNPSNIVPNFGIKNPDGNVNGPNAIIDKHKSVSNLFKMMREEKSSSFDDDQFVFVHDLDYFGNGERRNIPLNTQKSDIYLASFVETTTDNEDPTMYGYDIIIKYNTSPLFNGSILDFISSSSDIEITSRESVWETFTNQFFKFFKSQSNTTVTTGSTQSANPLPPVVVRGGLKPKKAYYLKKISGLDKLVESDISANSDSIKSMIDYGKDKITLSLYEDVTINTGYLAMLYKSLSWSRRNGKMIIPENLLRFDVDIVITEIRNYNRVINETKNGQKKLDIFVDMLSKYKYTLYDCQFLFNGYPHGNDMDLSAPKPVDSFDINFNYKYSTLMMEKFSFGATSSLKYSIDNSQLDVTSINSSDSNNAIINNSGITTYRVTQPLEEYDYYPKNSDNKINQVPSNPIDAMVYNNNQNSLSTKNALDKSKKSSDFLNIAKQSQSDKQLFSDLKSKLKRAVIHEANNQITTQARLLNRTLDNIRNAVGLGRMSAPTNVHQGSKLTSDIQNAFRDFIGQSVRGFFTPPSE